MKVLHVIPSLSPKHGGPTFAAEGMARSLSQAGVTVEMATTDDDGPGGRMTVPLGRRMEQAGHAVYYFRKQTEFYKVSRPLVRWLAVHATDYDLVHVHALFSYTSSFGARRVIQKGLPCVVTPHGVLRRWGMENRRRWLKVISFRCLELPVLRRATAMHYTSELERRETAAAGATAPGFVIPLGVDLAPREKTIGPERFWARWPQAQGREIVLSLSRLDPVKGLDSLLESFAKLKQRRPQALLVVAGRGEAAYERELQEAAARLGLRSDVIWPGFLAGDEKYSAMAAARIFVQPSHSENFGVTVAEALGCGVPVIATRSTPWEDLVTHQCGWWVNPGVDPLVASLSAAMALNEDERQAMGRRGRQLVESKYSWNMFGQQILAVYRRVLGRSAESRQWVSAG